jgi:hypothetical protein
MRAPLPMTSASSSSPAAARDRATLPALAALLLLAAALRVREALLTPSGLDEITLRVVRLSGRDDAGNRRRHPSTAPSAAAALARGRR